MIKKIITFIICFIPWILTNMLPLDYDYFSKITTPFFTPPKLFYPIAWTIIYILIAITMTAVFSLYKFRNVPIKYKTTLIINYLFNQSFTILFFGLKNNFLGFVSCLGTFITSLFLYEETSLINNKMSKLLEPYILLSLFATILSISIYLLNI